MKDQMKNHVKPEENFSETLKSVVQKIEVNASFKAELGKQLMEAHQPARLGFAQATFNRAVPAFGWMFALALMALVLNWVFRSIAPPPIPAAQATSISSTQETPSPIPTESTTPAPEDGSYDWRGTTLYLAHSLPESPAEANVYLLKEDRHAAVDQARALAQRFGIEGEVYQEPSDIAGTTDYIITDGKQKLQVRSDNYFTYYSDFDNFTLGKIPEEQAIIAIDNFLKKYGFDFEYHVASAAEMAGQQYYITPLISDDAEIRSDYMMPVRFEIIIDSTGQNIIFAGYPINYEAIGMFRIITVAEAFQSVLTPNPQFGIMESVRGNGGGGGGGTGFYKLNLSGTPVPFPSPTVQPDVTQGEFEYIVTENDTLSSIALNFGITVDQLVQANNLPPETNTVYTGQMLIIPNGQVTSVQEVALPEEQLVQLEIGQRIEGERGIFQVNIYEESQRLEYGFFITAIEKSNLPYMILEGPDLQSMQKYNNLPINLWGIVDRFDQYGKPIVKIDHYEIPFPDLGFQIIEGTQKMMEIDGKNVLTFTMNNGTTYVQIGGSVDPLDDHNLFGNEGDKLLLEVLIIPDEIYKGYPTLHMYSGNLAIDPVSGLANKIKISADQFNTYNEPPTSTEVYTRPTATIEKVELVYYVSNPFYGSNNQNPDGTYIQPAWRFYGHYSNGSEFEFIVQALKQEYLLPQLAPYTPPG